MEKINFWFEISKVKTPLVQLLPHPKPKCCWPVYYCIRGGSNSEIPVPPSQTLHGLETTGLQHQFSLRGGVVVSKLRICHKIKCGGQK